MKKFDCYEIMSVSEVDAMVQVRWYPKGHKDRGIVRAHYVPLECEVERWSEEDLITFWRQDVPDVPDVPNFITNALIRNQIVSR